MPAFNSIKTRLTLLLIGTIVLIMISVGVPVGNLVKHYFQQQANENFERLFSELGQRLHLEESNLHQHAQRMVMRDDLVASLNMIAQYSRPEDYQAIIFDIEKRLMLVELNKEVTAGDADEILIYDPQGRLIGYVSTYTDSPAGHISFQDGQAYYLMSDEGLVKWQEQILPERIIPQIGVAQMQGVQRIGLRHDTLGLSIYSTAPMLRHYPDGRRITVGYLVVKKIVGEGFIKQFGMLSGISAGLLFSNGQHIGQISVSQSELADVVQIHGLNVNTLPYSRINRDEDFLAVLRQRLDNGGYAHWVFSLPTDTVQEAIRNARSLIVIILLVAAGVILPVAIWLTHRVVSRPLDALSSAVSTMEQGDYEVSIPASANDELGRLSAAFNKMSSAIYQRQSELQENQTRYRTLIDNLPQRIYLKDRQSTYLSCNQRYAEDMGLDVDSIIGKQDNELYPEQIAAQMHQDDERIMSSGISDEREEVYRFNEKSILVHTIKIPVINQQGECQALLCIFWDITEEKEAENRLRQSATVFENTADGVIVTDLYNKILAVNKAFTEITGYSESETLGMKTSFRRSGRHQKDFYESMWRSIKTNGRWQGEIWNRRKSGEIYPEWMNISVVRDQTGQASNYVAVFSDITQIKRSQMQLDHMANHDPLTDLPNRTLLDDRLHQAIFRAKRHGNEIAVLFIDLDRFKNVNDTLGHPVGDKLLQEVAQRLQGLLRNQDTVARLGGDEFIILIEDLDRPDLAESVACKVIEAMSMPFHVADKEFFIGASIGISIFPEDGLEAATLIQHADAAMYRAKEEGRNTYQFYTRDLTENATERLQLESALRRAMEREELQLYYQPKVDLTSGQIIGAEALLRWIHPEMGFISPDKFIPLAEENGLILPIGEWVLREACAHTTAWVKDYPLLNHMAVNLSGVQIQRGDIITRVRHILDEFGLDAKHLHLEITESVLMQYPELATQVLEGLRDLGISLAVDDFGTGYSSLSYLKKFPIHTLKIDRSFVMDLPLDSNDTAITRAIIAMGKSLQLNMVAEGVETREQELFLQQEGCDIGQGYFYSRPVPAEEFTKLLKVGVLPLTNKAEQA